MCVCASVSVYVRFRVVEIGYKNLGFQRFFLQKKTKKTKRNLKSLNFRVLMFFLKKNLKNPDFRLTVTTKKLLPFSLVSCVYSYAVVYTWL